jgi:hypothetical protein
MISERALLSDSNSRWELINVNANILTPRNFPAVAQIDDNEIAILGGRGKNDIELSDLILFNTKSR